MLRDIVIALSLSNLCFVSAWRALLSPKTADYYYYWKSYTGLIEFAALVIDVLLLAALFLLAITIIRRSGSALLMKLARWAFLLLLIIPLNDLRTQINFLHGPRLAGLLGRAGLVVLGLLILALGAFVIWRWRERVVRVAVAAVLMLSPFVLVALGQAAWLAFKYGRPVAFAEHRAPALPQKQEGNGATPRVLWLIFDEMDERLSFSERPSTINLPELDRLRGEAIFATNASSPTPFTQRSIPSFVTGREVSRATPVSPDKLLVTFQGSRERVDWGTCPNIFSEARERGLNTAVVGWFHPYCRIIGNSLTYCAWEAASTVFGPEKTSLTKNMLAHVRNLLLSVPLAWRVLPLTKKEEDVRQRHISDYLSILEKAKKVATDTSLSMILVHWPIPHAPYIYDHSKASLSSTAQSSYLDNIELVDRTLGELRRTMESAGVWDSTTVLLTADHGWRTEMWRNSTAMDRSLFWTKGDVATARGLSGKTNRRIPFILKLAGQKEGVTYDQSFNTIITHDLFLALLGGELTSPESVVQWLDRHRPTEEK
jgi:hypothetical protein